MPRAPRLPGMEMPHIQAIDDAAEAYVKFRDQRMRLLAKEIDAHDQLLGLMKEHKLESYEFDERLVILDNKTKVKVKRKAQAANGEQE